MAAYYNEFDPRAADWLRELIKRGLIADGEVDERSILDVSADELRGFTQCHFFAGIGGWSYALRLAGWPDDRPVWTGSPPCQPFSAAGMQKGRDDDRHLAPHFIGLVGAARPSMLFGEQVASAAVFGPSAKGNRPGFEGAPPWAWFDDLSDRLEAARYAVGTADIAAAGVGAPHIRQRAFFGAVNLERLADAAGGGRREECSDRRGGLAGDRPEGRPAGLGAGRGDSRMADGGGARLEGQPWHGDDGGEPRRFDAEQAGHASARGRAGGMADAKCGGRGRREGAATGGVYNGEDAGRVEGDDGSLRHGEAGSIRLANASDRPGQRSFPRTTLGGLPAETGRDLPLQPAGAPDSPWGAADWLYCRDGKWRPVEPGSFPLAHGVSARVGRLRGYGNAIVPQAAATFIESFLKALETINEHA